MSGYFARLVRPVGRQGRERTELLDGHGVTVSCLGSESVKARSPRRNMGQPDGWNPELQDTTLTCTRSSASCPEDNTTPSPAQTPESQGCAQREALALGMPLVQEMGRGGRYETPTLRGTGVERIELGPLGGGAARCR